MRYRTNTTYGSSGSPCFDKDGVLLALHHATHPNKKEPKDRFNQGIPVAEIRRYLKGLAAGDLSVLLDEPYP